MKAARNEGYYGIITQETRDSWYIHVYIYPRALGPAGGRGEILIVNYTRYRAYRFQSITKKPAEIKKPIDRSVRARERAREPGSGAKWPFNSAKR